MIAGGPCALKRRAKSGASANRAAIDVVGRRIASPGDLLEHGHVHVGQRVEVKARLGTLVLAELREQRLTFREAADVEDEIGRARREREAGASPSCPLA
jgi:hypothetical protein